MSDELKKRTKDFSLRVMQVVGALPNNMLGRAIGGQLIRSGTSVGSNCRAAYCGRSKAEFIAKLGVVVEEADESAFWLELIMEGKLLPETRILSLHQEAKELVSIFIATIKTLKSKT
jgi:four helix bundle protein